ncbi:MAG: tRNA (adenosine(37)-N6)-threonylcarbamoyltransferase complex dimerization subunit type 1 TsaB [Flavobacteriales bacterium]|nr:tRNA (adenosine(37)-N6)-threonylcarbamoyltransferase complex dimerization subunit type 1 TsaB [Flavobacteriales bacterium]
MKILCIETATKNCSVAIGDESGVLAQRSAREEGYVHAEQLHVFLDAVIKEAGTPDAVAVSRGPGSYTGLRIGVAAAKGLCYALEIPLISLDTTEVLAAAVSDTENIGYIVPMIDARRQEVYASVYHVVDGVLHLENEIQSLVIESDPFSFDAPAVFIGDGAGKFHDVLKEPHYTILSQHPEASDMLKLALIRAAARDFQDVAYFEPFYLKEFIAGTPKKPF